VANDRNARLRVEALGKLVEHRAHLWFDLGAAGIEREVARHAELELVVGCANDIDSGALRRARHFRAFRFHVPAPQIAGHGAGCAADDCAGRCVAAGCGTNCCSCCGANTGTGCSAALAFRHRLAAGNADKSRQYESGRSWTE